MARVKKSGEVTGVRTTRSQSRVPPPSRASEPAKTPSSASKTTSGRADHRPARAASPTAPAAKSGAPKKARKAVAAGRSSSAARRGTKAAGKAAAPGARAKTTTKRTTTTRARAAAKRPTTTASRGDGKPKAGRRKGGGAGRGKQDRGRKPVPPREPLVSYRVRVLDPVEKCGPGTSVQQLFRVDESVDGARRAHLVFFDRHGWYCEHGRNCPAVVHAKRTGKLSAPQLGRH